MEAEQRAARLLQWSKHQYQVNVCINQLSEQRWTYATGLRPVHPVTQSPVHPVTQSPSHRQYLSPFSRWGQEVVNNDMNGYYLYFSLTAIPFKEKVKEKTCVHLLNVYIYMKKKYSQKIKVRTSN